MLREGSTGETIDLAVTRETMEPPLGETVGETDLLTKKTDRL